MAGPTKTDATADGGLGSLQQLYDMVAGKTSTTSGGMTTKVETGSMDQAGMNAMLQQALSSTSGLASVAGGQRTAGGYGSSTNQMLVNDLLTRTAGQIAANNKTTTTSVSTPKVVQQSGGATVSGTAKVAALLKGMQLMSGKENDLLGNMKKALGMDSKSSDTEYGNPANASISGQSDGNPNYYSNSPSNMVVDNSSPDMSANLMSDMSVGPDLTNWSDMTAETGGVDLTQYDVSSDWNQGPGITESATDWTPAPDYVTEEFMPEVTGYADGGEVTAKKPSVLGSSQFSTVKQASLTSADMTTNAANAVPQTSGSLGSFANSIGSGSSGGTGNGTTNFSGTGIGDMGGASIGGMSLSDAGKAMGIAGALAQDKNASMIGMGLGIAGAPNPAMAAGMTAANIATKGLAGSVMSAVSNPSFANITDIAGAIANPAIGLANTALGLVGLNSIGTSMQNAYTSLSVEGPTSVTDSFNPMTQSIQAQQRDVAENPAIPDPVAAIEAAIADDAVANLNNNGGGGNFGGFGDRGPGGSSGDSAAAAGGATASGPGGYGSSDGGDSGSDGMADGGLKQGPGTGISDSIPTNLSAGEFVLSKDVVDAIGIDKLQALQDKYHTPAAVQRLQQFARPTRTA